MPKKLYNEPSPLETRVVSKNFGLENSESLEVLISPTTASSRSKKRRR